MTLSERTEPAKTKLCNDYTEFNDSRLCVRRDVMHELSLGCRLSDLSRVRLVYHLASRSVHLPSRQLASWLGSVCARGGLGQRPIDQCWWRQARACRRLCVLSLWCLCASEVRGTRVVGIYMS